MWAVFFLVLKPDRRLSVCSTVPLLASIPHQGCVAMGGAPGPGALHVMRSVDRKTACVGCIYPPARPRQGPKWREALRSPSRSDRAFHADAPPNDRPAKTHISHSLMARCKGWTGGPGAGSRVVLPTAWEPFCTTMDPFPRRLSRFLVLGHGAGQHSHQHALFVGRRIGEFTGCMACIDLDLPGHWTFEMPLALPCYTACALCILMYIDSPNPRSAEDVRADRLSAGTLGQVRNES